uniref:Trichome birefringence-like N-terminal domain-containing protein n=1 Tax=Aegilops tauschii subsp. strangulata TaxID=200361 RepID=A0A453FUZ0_AEGTS
MSKGEWVFDNASYPLYREEECSFLTSQVTCMKNGRRDDNYQKWRWQPKDCDMPRFDAKLFIERLRNKRFMFVGDSLNRNQWESMVCLVQSAVSPDKKYVTWEDQRVVFHAWVSTYHKTMAVPAASLSRPAGSCRQRSRTNLSQLANRQGPRLPQRFFKRDVVRSGTCTVAVGGGLASTPTPTTTTYPIRLGCLLAPASDQEVK